MKSLYRSHELAIQSAYIIYVPNNNLSIDMARRCQASCERVGQASVIWPGFDGTGGTVVPPPQLRDQEWVSWLKVMDHWQSPSEIACSLSHISLWAKCMQQDQPLIVLEHDAVMIRSLAHHRFTNTVQYLGCAQQTDFDLARGDTVPYSTINQNWRFINRAHAYSIDPAAAKRLFGMVLDRGIFESLDVMIMNDAVAIVQDGVYAQDQHQDLTTITDRKQTHDHGPGSLRI